MAKSNKGPEPTANDAVAQVSPQETTGEVTWTYGVPVENTAQETPGDPLATQDAPAEDGGLKQGPTAPEDPQPPAETPDDDAAEGDIPASSQFKVGDKVFCLLSQSRYLRGKVVHEPGETDCYGIQGRAFKSVNKTSVIAVHRSRLAPVAPEGCRKIDAFYTAPSGMKFLLKELILPAEQ